MEVKFKFVIKFLFELGFLGWVHINWVLPSSLPAFYQTKEILVKLYVKYESFDIVKGVPLEGLCLKP